MSRLPALLCLSLAGCATGRGALQPERELTEPEAWVPFPGALPRAAAPGVGALIASRAGALAGRPSLKPIAPHLPDDCTGTVREAYAAAGAELMGEGERGDNGVTAMHRKAARLGALHTGTPSPGDLIFFRETYDRNRNGRFDDGLTHVGVVESVEPSGTVIFVHRGGSGIARARMSLWAPEQRTGPGGVVLNEPLRPRSRRSRAFLTSELFGGYASAEVLAGPPRRAQR